MTDDLEPEFAREALEGTELTEQRELLELVHRLPEALPLPAGSRAVRARLLEETSRPPERYAPFTRTLSELYDISRDEVRALLVQSADPKAWQRSGLPGIKKLPVKAGVSRSGSQSYLVTFAAGARFPEHHHDGLETVLLLAGSYTEHIRSEQSAPTFQAAPRLGKGPQTPRDSGLGRQTPRDKGDRVYATGAIHLMEPGTAHSFTIASDEDCVAATLLHGTLNFRSLPLRLLARLLGH